jgi:hypothetical protein
MHLGQFTRIEFFDASFHTGSPHTLWCVRALGTGFSTDWFYGLFEGPDEEFEDSDGRIATRRVVSHGASCGDDDIEF